MLNSFIKYAKLAWVYAKGICGFRHKEYDLQFVYVPEDKLWYIDMWWPGDRYNLAMVAGSNHLLSFLDIKKKIVYVCLYVRVRNICQIKKVTLNA